VFFKGERWSAFYLRVRQWATTNIAYSNQIQVCLKIITYLVSKPVFDQVFDPVFDLMVFDAVSDLVRDVV
jgi:hypothetical protein